MKFIFVISNIFSLVTYGYIDEIRWVKDKYIIR